MASASSNGDGAARGGHEARPAGGVTVLWSTRGGEGGGGGEGFPPSAARTAAAAASASPLAGVMGYWSSFMAVNASAASASASALSWARLASSRATSSYIGR